MGDSDLFEFLEHQLTADQSESNVERLALKKKPNVYLGKWHSGASFAIDGSISKNVVRKVRDAQSSPSTNNFGYLIFDGEHMPFPLKEGQGGQVETSEVTARMVADFKAFAISGNPIELANPSPSGVKVELSDLVESEGLNEIHTGEVGVAGKSPAFPTYAVGTVSFASALAAVAITLVLTRTLGVLEGSFLILAASTLLVPGSLQLRHIASQYRDPDRRAQPKKESP